MPSPRRGTSATADSTEELVSSEQPHVEQPASRLALRGIEADLHTVRTQSYLAHTFAISLANKKQSQPQLYAPNPPRAHSPVNPRSLLRSLPHPKMASASPRFYQQPLRYLKWASINKPAYFYSIIVGSAGPVIVFTVPPIRRYLGEEPRPKIPLTYPIPKGQRPKPTGFDDE